MYIHMFLPVLKLFTLKKSYINSTDPLVVVSNTVN